MDCMRRKTSGFTLLEVLVALVLLTLFAFAAYRGLNAVLEVEAHSRKELARWQKLSRVFTRIEADLQDAVLIPPAAGRNPAVFIVERNDSTAVGFSMHRLTAEEGAGGVEQVNYRFIGRQLSRSASPVSGQGGEMLPSLLLEALEHVSFRYLDGRGIWQADWHVATELPRAVEVAMAWPDGLQLRRVFRTQ